MVFLLCLFRQNSVGLSFASEQENGDSKIVGDVVRYVPSVHIKDILFYLNNFLFNYKVIYNDGFLAIESSKVVY